MERFLKRFKELQRSRSLGSIDKVHWKGINIRTNYCFFSSLSDFTKVKSLKVITVQNTTLLNKPGSLSRLRVLYSPSFHHPTMPGSNHDGVIR